jgi:hypothetical protein
MIETTYVTQTDISDGIAMGSMLVGGVLWIIKFYVLISNGYKLRVSPDEFSAFKFYQEIIRTQSDTNSKILHSAVLYGTYFSFITALFCFTL